MNTARQIGIGVLKRLLVGERGDVPLHLAMLLEKSSPLDSGDRHYHEILPPEIADLRLSVKTTKEIVSTLCAEVIRNPDEALISAISFTGSDLPTRTVAKILTNPPRSLTTCEIEAALALLAKFLPHRLRQHPSFIKRSDLRQLVSTIEKFHSAEEIGINRSAQIGIKHHSRELLQSLGRLGIRGS